MEKAMFTKDDIGIILDCSADSADTLNTRTVYFANDNGANIQVSEQKESDDYSEMLSYAADEAVEYLNTLCDDEVCFIFDDNSLFIVSIDEE